MKHIQRKGKVVPGEGALQLLATNWGPGAHGGLGKGTQSTWVWAPLSL